MKFSIEISFRLYLDDKPTATTTSPQGEQCQVEFKTPKKYSTGSKSLPVFVSLTDINDDKRSDIIVANQLANNVGVLFNHDDSEFDYETLRPNEYLSGPAYISVVDVNNDAKLDIIVANTMRNNVGVLLNDGFDQFPSVKHYDTGKSTNLSGIAVVDINGDKKPDIIVTTQNTNSVSVFLNSGGGQFSNKNPYNIPSGVGVMCPQVVDVNGDTRPDIIVANSGDASIGISFNSGNGKFTKRTTFSTGKGSQPKSVFVVDVNGDNKPDLIVGNFKTNNVGVLLNAGNGKFLNQKIYSTGLNSQPLSVFVADINCDNKPDIIVANSNKKNIGIFFNFGNGTFQRQTTYETGGSTKPWSVAVGNANDDNKPDIIFSDIAKHEIVILIRY
ncbi:unnamed protein product [Adineta steineri]|uniref:VCBS repeat-containing protein n=1 Tax=Adineta steineri TaxID=433720 RepID=A0A814GVL0_9BILA|nr:unnamed protein product [Adineta steineri]